MVARSLVTDKIHGNNNIDSEELSYVCDREPAEDEYNYTYLDVWKYFIIARIALDSPPSSWSEVSRNLQNVKLRSRIPN